MKKQPLWTILHGDFYLEMLGFLPSFLDMNDPQTVREQFQLNYWPGWNPMRKHWTFDPKTHILQYNGGVGPLYPLASTVLRDEKVYFYEHAFVCVVQPNGDFEVARMD